MHTRARHWELDDRASLPNESLRRRRRAEFITPIPKPEKRKGSGRKSWILSLRKRSISSPDQQYDPTPIINEFRHYVDQWRSLPIPTIGGSHPKPPVCCSIGATITSRHPPFFCQVEAVETAIWLTEVAPKWARSAKNF